MLDVPWNDIEREILQCLLTCPLEGLGTLEEIADAIAFSRAPLAGYIAEQTSDLTEEWPGM